MAAWTKTVGLAAVICTLMACQPKMPISDTAASQMAAIGTENIVLSNQAGIAFVNGAPVSDPMVDGGAKNFIQAVMSDDLNLLLAYYPAGTRLSRDDVDPSFARQVLRPIIAGGPMSAIEISRSGHVFSVLFYQSRHAKQLAGFNYWQTAYQKTLFVCNFDDSSGRWMAAHPVLCYNETEGPFEPEPNV